MLNICKNIKILKMHKSINNDSKKCLNKNIKESLIAIIGFKKMFDFSLKMIAGK